MSKAMNGRNYGDRGSGGDAYAMGEELNMEIRVAWQMMREYSRDSERRFDAADELAYRQKRLLQVLLSIRRAARGNAIRDVVSG